MLHREFNSLASKLQNDKYHSRAKKKTKKNARKKEENHVESVPVTVTV